MQGIKIFVLQENLLSMWYRVWRVCQVIGLGARLFFLYNHIAFCHLWSEPQHTLMGSHLSWGSPAYKKGVWTKNLTIPLRTRSSLDEAWVSHLTLIKLLLELPRRASHPKTSQSTPFQHPLKQPKQARLISQINERNYRIRHERDVPSLI